MNDYIYPGLPLADPHWKQIRKQALEFAGNKCEHCESTESLHAHHLIYRNPPESTTREDAMILCNACHLRFHWWLDKTVFPLSSFSRESTVGALRAIRYFKEKELKMQQRRESPDVAKTLEDAGRKGGCAKSLAKTLAARENARKPRRKRKMQMEALPS